MSHVHPFALMSFSGLDTAESRAVGMVGFAVAPLPTDAIGSATVTFTGLQPGSDVVILRAGTEEVLLDANEVSGSTYTYPYSRFSAPTVVDIAFYKAGFVPHTSIRNFTLPASDAVLPIAQVADRNYRNPT